MNKENGDPPKTNYWIIGIVAVFAAAVIGGASFFFGYTNAPKTEMSAKSFVTQPETQEPEKDLKIKGNRKSKIYHLPGCASYDRISERNIVWFKTTADAEAAGYRIAKNC